MCASELTNEEIHSLTVLLQLQAVTQSHLLKCHKCVCIEFADLDQRNIKKKKKVTRQCPTETGNLNITENKKKD